VGEDEKQRVDRELIELLNELRVALPGVQVLFAFLLIVPFSNGFPKMTSLQRDVYFVAFLCATVSAVLLIAPSAHHRLRFRAKEKEQLLFRANKLAIAGLGFLAAAMSAVVYVITDVIFKEPWAAILSALAAALFAWIWYVVPLSRRFSGDD
jgi:O-antigen/teichoic acid export membrane protein